MSISAFFLTLIIVGVWTWLGATYMENMSSETPRGMKAIFSCIIMGPLLGTLLACIILWEMGFGKEKEKRKREEQKQYEGEAILKKIQFAMNNTPTYQYEIDGKWLPRDEAIKKLVDNYFNRH
jgi:hypothetical protein